MRWKHDNYIRTAVTYVFLKDKAGDILGFLGLMSVKEFRMGHTFSRRGDPMLKF